MYYVPETERPVLAEAGIAKMKEVTINTADGLSLLSWYVAPENNRPTVLFFHGNARNIGHRAFKAREFHKAGFGVLLLEYRGYGGNPGSPTEEGLLADGEAGLNWLKANGVSMDKMVLYGESLGTGVAVQLAARHQPAALILEAAYDDFADLVGSKVALLPFASHLVKDRYDSISYIGKVNAPLLMVHGDEDVLIPLWRAEKLYNAANQPKSMVVLKGGNHNDLYAFGAWQEIERFLERTFPAPNEEINKPQAQTAG